MQSAGDNSEPLPVRRGSCRASKCGRIPSVLRLCCYSFVVLITVFVQVGKTVKHENFKTCSQSGFCRRNRALADNATAVGSSWVSPYELDTSSITLEKGQLKGTIWKVITGQQQKIELPLVFSFYQQGIARVQIDETRRQKGEIELRNDSKARKERYNQAENFAIASKLHLNEDTTMEKLEEGEVTKVHYGGASPFEAIIRHNPFEVRFVRGGEVHVVLNERHLLNVEHWRAKPETQDGEDMGEWDETFGGNTDSKPRGMITYQSFRSFRRSITDSSRPGIRCIGHYIPRL